MKIIYNIRKKFHLVLTVSLISLLAACGGGSSDTAATITPVTPVTPSAIAPTVILTVPAKTNPIANSIATNLNITAKFSQNMLASSINTTSMKVSCPSGTPFTDTVTVTYDTVNKLATLKHTTAFPPNTTCVATITTAAKNLAGVGLAMDYVWSFTTGSGSDLTPPTVIARSPINAVAGVCLSKDVVVAFSEPMDSSTITSASFNVTNAANPAMPGVITYDALSNTATFAVTNPTGYAANTIYTINISGDIKDLAGIPIVANTSTFTTGSTACNPIPVVNLGSIAPYGTFGGGAGATNQGINTVINGDMGTTAACTLFTGFHTSTNIYTETTLNIGDVTGDILCGPPAPGTVEQLALATVAATDALIAYNELALKTPSTAQTAELGGITLAAGTYKATAAFTITSGNLTLDAAGDPDAVWVFQVPSSLTVGLSATPRSVLLLNGAQAKNVYWQVGSLARIEDGSSMVGTIIAQSGVTISTAGQTIQTTLVGRAIGLAASVTMVNTTITVPN